MNRKVILSLGSNLGERMENIRNAEVLIESTLGAIVSRSSYYETEPWGKLDQQAFINSAVSLFTDIMPSELLVNIQEIQKILGKKKIEKWGPRIIDIDIIFFADWIVNKEYLIIPHPQVQYRNFVMIPILDIEKNIMHPKLNKAIEELYLDSPDESEVKKLPDTL